MYLDARKRELGVLGDELTPAWSGAPSTYLVKVRENSLLRHTLFENAANTSNTLCVVLQV